MGAAGQAGVCRMLELLETEIEICLGLLGVTGFADLDESYLHPVEPMSEPHVFSAFPLLEEDY
jgi:glycolate oxidase